MIEKVTIENITHAVTTTCGDPMIVCTGWIWWDKEMENPPEKKPLNHIKEINCKDCLIVIREFKNIKGK